MIGTATDPSGPPKVPDDPGFDDPGFWKTGGGQNPGFNPGGGGGFFGGGGGGGGSGGYFASPQYSGFTGYDPMMAGLRRKYQLGASGATGANGTTMAAPPGQPQNGYGQIGDVYGRLSNPGAANPHDINSLMYASLGGQGQGYFSPYGQDPAYFGMLQNEMGALGKQQEQAAVLGAGLDYGQAGDMYARAGARTMARQGAANNTANQIGQARMQAAQNYQNMMNNYIQGQMGQVYDEAGGYRNFMDQKRLQADANKNKGNPWMQAAGTIGGAGLGFFLGGPPGAMAGANIGGKVGGAAGGGGGGGNFQYQPYQYQGGGMPTNNGWYQDNGQQIPFNDPRYGWGY
jgi:hypothetical protein